LHASNGVAADQRLEEEAPRDHAARATGEDDCPGGIREVEVFENAAKERRAGVVRKAEEEQASVAGEEIAPVNR
jgi:hypothetical protein